MVSAAPVVCSILYTTDGRTARVLRVAADADLAVAVGTFLAAGLDRLTPEARTRTLALVHAGRAELVAVVDLDAGRAAGALALRDPAAADDELLLLFTIAGDRRPAIVH